MFGRLFFWGVQQIDSPNISADDPRHCSSVFLQKPERGQNWFQKQTTQNVAFNHFQLL
jgi:hypothetical protein